MVRVDSKYRGYIVLVLYEYLRFQNPIVHFKGGFQLQTHYCFTIYVIYPYCIDGAMSSPRHDLIVQSIIGR